MIYTLVICYDGILSPPILAQERMKVWGEGVNLAPPPPYKKKSCTEAIQNRIKSANFLPLDNHPLSMLVLFIDWAPTL